MPPKPKIAVGARVSLKSSKSSDKYGTVVKASARREWLITWDKPMKTGGNYGQTLWVVYCKYT